MEKRARWGIFLLVALVVPAVLLLRLSSRKHPGQIGRLKLPVGQVTPAIGFGAARGIILASDGSLWDWGEEKLGVSIMGAAGIKTQPFLRRLGKENDWVSIAAGLGHNLAIKADGTLWHWGENVLYPSGDELVIARSTLVPSFPGTDWKQAAEGGSHSVALKKDGSLWAWGQNNFGQLGIGTLRNSLEVPVQVGSATNWIKVWAGGSQTLGMRSDRSLWDWGENPALPTTAFPNTNNFLVPVRLSPDTNWVDVGMEFYMAFAIKSDGTLWAWGRIPDFVKGATALASGTTLSRVGIDTDWRGCSSGLGSHQVLVKTDGSLCALDGSYYMTAPPLKRIDLQKDIVAFAAGGDGIGAALTSDGEVWTWGLAFGEQSASNPPLQFLSRLISQVGLKTKWSDPKSIRCEKPWQLGNMD